ncbi:DUF1402 family protein [soil metagenome]
MSSATTSHRFFAPVSIAILGLVAAMLTAIGCTKADLFNSAQDSVNPDSADITLENYQSHKIAIVVPPGNHNPEINWSNLNTSPIMPAKALSRVEGLNETQLKAALEQKYQSSIQSIAKDPQTVEEIRKAARIYGIDPVLILGNIVGEHVFNVGITDSIQGYVVQSLSWGAKWALKFSSNGVKLTDLLKQAPFGRCESRKADSHADYWDCVSDVYESNYRGKADFGSKGFKFTFFDPVAVGMTYGLGQLDPIRALMVADMVNRNSGFAMISIEDPTAIYADIINPRKAVHYIAANIVVAIERYKRISNFDISKNTGVVATLYNLGKERSFATKRYNDNVRSLRAGRGVSIPVESYYGFFVNEKEPQLREFIRTGRPQ